ncbi:hypothetical protein Plec18167_009669 [Paecilomyces lecythidis]|uniref:Core-binding (CB) domain-containing protein n=1 Tax=Paecilomyces lecythidis TaxID=3004212 RepID=A0ABR3WM08_9EURO
MSHLQNLDQQWQRISTNANTLLMISDTIQSCVRHSDPEEDTSDDDISDNGSNEAPIDWMEREQNIDRLAIQQRRYDKKTKDQQDRIWKYWTQFCEETGRNPRKLLAQDPPQVQTSFNFWDYTITRRRGTFKAASTLQTYYNQWTLMRRRMTGLSIPDAFKDAMCGVRDQLADKHGLRIDQQGRTNGLRSEDIFELLRTLWTTTNEDWDPLQLSVYILLAGPTGNRRNALLSLRHCDIQISLLPDPNGKWPRRVMEIRPHKTKSYRGKKKKT